MNIKEIVIPTKQEKTKLASIISEITKKINSQMKKDKVLAKIFVGGSVGKGTWLPGLSDIDLFLRFNYAAYKVEPFKLSEIAEKSLSKIFKLEKLHGSRDYFSINYKGYYCEIVPVLEIKTAKQAKNITDVSPLHVNWIKKNANAILKNEIRMTKQFCKAQGVYGAESFINGLSGHVIEILTIYYGSFEEFVKEIKRIKDKQVIDTERYYKSSKMAMKKINASKLHSPLILVDPIQPERNAAAALRKEKLNKLQKASDAFLNNPTLDFFKIKKLKIGDLIKNQKNRKLIVISANIKQKKIDIKGAKLLKIFNYISYLLRKNDFDILEKGWYWSEKGAATFWFYLPKELLPKTRIHLGPPKGIKKEFITAFKKEWKKHKVKISKQRYYVEVQRKYRKPEAFLENIIKKDEKLSNYQIRIKKKL